MQAVIHFERCKSYSLMLTMTMKKINILLIQKKCICRYSLAHSDAHSIWQIV